MKIQTQEQIHEVRVDADERTTLRLCRAAESVSPDTEFQLAVLPNAYTFVGGIWVNGLSREQLHAFALEILQEIGPRRSTDED